MTTTKETTMTIEELIHKQRQMNGEIPEPEPTPPPVRDFTALLEKQREIVMNRWETVDVALAGETLQVSVGRLFGFEWLNLTDVLLPKTPADRNLGYDSAKLPRAYPAQRLKLNDEPTNADQWAQVWDLLEPEDRKSIGAVMWFLNVGEPDQVRASLGVAQ